MSFIVILSACNNTTVEEEIHIHLEEAVRLEADFENQQSEITQLEMEEQEIYNEIIDLGMDEFDQITDLSERAIENINTRTNLIALEKESIQASQKEFQKIEGLMEDITDEEVKSKANSMFEVMNNRYTSYEQLNESYLDSLELESELYEMLQREELKQEELTEHINKINDSYQKVLDANEQFNQYTVKYNELKKEFYDLAGIDVSFEENPTTNDEGSNENSEE